MNTLQQVSGAAGIALFITLFTIAALTNAGYPLAVLADGVGTAFGVGAAISAIGIVLALFLRKPANHAPSRVG